MKRRTAGKWMTSIFLLVITLMVPYVATLAWTGNIEGDKNTIDLESGKTVLLDRGGLPKVVNLEEYLIGIVANQMPVEYGLEPLRAQAIIARTYVYNNMNGENEIPESALDVDYLDPVQLKAVWGDKAFGDNYELLKEAVASTKNMVMKFEDTYIDAMFHMASSGQTRSGDEKHPYLTAVSSAGDVDANDYLSVTLWEPETFAKKINEIHNDQSVTADHIFDTLQIISRDTSGYVTQVQIGAGTYTGEEIQATLQLKSSCFYFEAFENKIRIVCKGIGHGYGMSQWGAKKRFEEGEKAEEILSYYYKNINIITE